MQRCTQGQAPVRRLYLAIDYERDHAQHAAEECAGRGYDALSPWPLPQAQENGDGAGCGQEVGQQEERNHIVVLHAQPDHR